MKRWTKKRGIANWHSVSVPVELSIADYVVFCQNHPSKNRFYAAPYSRHWLFQDKDDAAEISSKVGQDYTFYLLSQKHK